MIYEKIFDSLFAMYESVCYDYEYTVITETIDNPDNSKVATKETTIKNRLKSIIESVWRVIRNIITRIQEKFSRLKNIILDLKNSKGIDNSVISNTAMVVKTDCELPLFELHPIQYISFIEKLKVLLGGKGDVEKDTKLTDEINKMRRRVSVKAGNKIGSFSEYDKLFTTLRDVDQNSAAYMSIPDLSPEEAEARGKLHKAVSGLFSDISSLMNSSIDFNESITSKLNALNSLQQNKKKPQTESVNLNESQFASSLLYYEN